MCVCSYIYMVYMYYTMDKRARTRCIGYRETRKDSRNDRRYSQSRSHLQLHSRSQRVAAGVLARGVRVRLSRASSRAWAHGCTHHIATRSTSGMKTTSEFVPLLRAAIFSVLGAFISNEKCLPCAIDAHRPLSSHACQSENCRSSSSAFQRTLGTGIYPLKFSEKDSPISNCRIEKRTLINSI